MNFRDVELLSEYLDGRLKPSDAARVEARLSRDANLKATLDDLRETRTLLRRLPQRRAPRNFRLTPKMAGIKPPEARAYPAFRFATGLAAFLFVAAVALNAFTPFAARHLAAAPAPQAFGMGGGGGGGAVGGGAPESSGAAPAATQAPAATAAPPAAPFAAVMPTPTAEGTLAIAEATAAAAQAQDQTKVAAGAAPSEQANKTGPMLSTPPVPQAQLPLPWGVVIALGVVMLACAVGAWIVQRNQERRIRERWNQK